MTTEIGDFDLEEFVEVSRAIRKIIDEAGRITLIHAMLNGTPVPTPIQAQKESTRILNPEIVEILLEVYKNRH